MLEVGNQPASRNSCAARRPACVRARAPLDFCIESHRSGTRATLIARLRGTLRPAVVTSGVLAARSVVVIDDDPSVREIASAYLERDGYDVLVAASGSEGLELAERAAPGLIVLDLMLPDLDGEEVCRRIRRVSDVPIVMLTAKSSVDERVSGLLLGADDYLAKPFSPRELAARVGAVLRRSGAVEAPLVPVMSFDAGRLEIDTVRQRVWVDGVAVELTRREYDLLVALARYPGRVYGRAELNRRVQGYEYEGYERTIDSHVKNLRKKIELAPHSPRYIQTVYGVGYRFAEL